VRLLLDTHTLLWWLNDSALRPTARNAIADPGNDVFVSGASAWEISIKEALGKLSAPSDISAQITANGFEPLPITLAHGFAAGALPRHHDDPFDRMLIAQAQMENLITVSRDSRFARYDIQLIEA